MFRIDIVIIVLRFDFLVLFYKYTAYLDEQRKRESHQPKTYSKKLIEEFDRKWKQTKEQQEQQFLKKFFNYPDKWLRIQHELPPSLRLIDPSLLKKKLQKNSFG